MDDWQLLRRYAANASDEAFGQLVDRHVNLVHSAALRLVNGDAHLAHDVAQLVFTNLARKAAALPPDVVLAGWLHRDTCFTALEILRKERRRRAREHQAVAMNEIERDSRSSEWQSIRPLIDDALNQLHPTDRDALLLRFFEQCSLVEIGRRLGFGESGASRRVSRALDKLRELLAKRGVTTTASALSVALGVHGVQMSPAGLGAKLAKASLINAATTATSLTSTLGLVALMTAKFKILLAVAAAILLGSGIVYRVNRSRDTGEKASSSPSLATNPVNASPPKLKTKLNPMRSRQQPALEATDPAVAAALAKIRAVLEAPGRVILYPQPEMKKAVLELHAHYKEAIPILREGLRHPDWEVRRRAAGGLAYLSIAAPDAVPDLIEMLREAPTLQDAIAAAGALQSIGVKADIVPSLVDALAANQQTQSGLEAHFPELVREASQKGLESADGASLDNAIAGLTAENDDARLRALMKIVGLGPAAIDAIPALKEFITQPNREDLKMYAENLLAEIDPNFARERDDPDLQQAQAERARAFSEKARAGHATVQELIAALREFPQTIPVTAQALGKIGFEEMSRRAHESPQAQQEFMDVNIMLTQIAAGNLPLEARLAASDAFRELQPMREKLLYSVEETAPAFRVITNALPQLSGAAREQIQSRFGNMINQAQLMWTMKQRSGGLTDYQGSHLETFARELAKTDRKIHDDFVAAMRKADPKFLQGP
jgi:RNA polymerase sigma factor (sigma-70 family)